MKATTEGTSSTNKNKYEFEKSPKLKGTCPGCQQQKVFRYYEGLPIEFGKCERINSCNYHNQPNSTKLSSLGFQTQLDYTSSSPKAEIKILVPDAIALDCLNNSDSPFHQFCERKLKITPEHLKKWKVGSYADGTKFVYARSTDKEINIVTIHYLVDDDWKNCKRDKSKNPFSLSAKKGTKYELCLFGEHLLSEDKICCLVESEKTAVIASFFYPEFDWLATGGANKLTDDKIHALYNREIYYLNDADKAGKENSTIKKMMAYGLNYEIVNLFPDRNDGYDLADAIIEGYKPEIVAVAPTKPKTQVPKEKTKIISQFERVENFISDRYEIRLNEVACEIEFRIKGSQDRFKPFNENNLYRELQKNHLNFSQSKLIALLHSDFVPRHNPFFSYFENLPNWNKEDKDHIDLLCHYIPVKKEDTERFKRHFKKMLVRCIACSLNDVFNKQAFILVHDMQNSGKSTFCRWLCPPSLSAYIAENINMDKDSLIALTENFIINMDELATLSRAEINQLKAFMSKDVVKVRPPYARKAIMMNRRANFVGSTNKSEFLNDETGSVRWLCFELSDKINFNYKNDININDIWSQAYSLFKNGFKYELTPEEIAENEEANKNYRITTTEQELIQERYCPSTKDDFGSMFLTASDIKLRLDEQNPGQKLNHVNIGKTLKILGFKQEQKYNGRYQVKGYWVVQKS